MKEFILFRLFLREFKKERGKFFLSIFAIIWGTLTTVLLLAFGEGLKTQLVKGIYGLGERIVIIWGGITDIPYHGLPKGRKIQLNQNDVKLLQILIPEIEMISPEVGRWDIPFSYKGKTALGRLIGVYPSYKDMRTHYPQMGGRFINPLDLKFKRRVVFLGNKLKDKLFGKEEAVGKTLYIENVPFKVIGILKEKSQINMIYGPDSEKGVIPFSTYQAMFGEKYIDLIIYRPKKASQAKQIEEKVYKSLGSKYRFDPKDAQAIGFFDLIENEKVTRNILLGIQIFLGIVGGLSLIVTGTGVSNIMYITVKRRTKETGIKIALGAKRWHIMSLFLLESLAIVFIGGVIGMIISVFLVKLLQIIPIKNEGLQFLGKPIISIKVTLITIFVLGIVGILSGIFPARKASSLNPIEALRYE